MNDDFRETPSAFRGPFAKANVELSTSTRMTPVAETPAPVQEEIPISQLPLADTLFGREQVPIVQDGITKRTTAGAIAAAGHAAIDLVKVGSLAYAPAIGQTAFPLAVPDHYGNTYRLTTDNAVQVTVGGLRLTPDDGTGNFGGFNVDVTSNQVNLVTGFGTGSVIIVNAGDIVLIDVYALAGAPVSETSTLSLTYAASIGQNIFPLSVPDHYGNTHTLLSNDVVRVTAGGIRLAQDDGSGFGAFNVDYANNLIILAPPFSSADVVIVSGDVIIIDILVPISTTNVILSDAPDDGAVYGRKSHAWSQITHNNITDWTAAVAGSAVTILPTPPSTPVIGQLWFDDSSAGGQMYLWYDDGNTRQWVPIVNQGLTGSGGGGPGPPSPSAPSNTAAPVITGAATVGSTLTTTNGTWTNSPLTYQYQWTRNGSNIFGATASSYLLTSGDAGTTIRCSVTASNAAGSATAASNVMNILPTAPVNSVPPVVSGSTALGSTLTTTTGTWSGSPTFTYQWQRDGVTISGAIASTYVIVTADQGHSLSAVVTATNAAGSASASSNTLAIPAFTYPATNLTALYSLRKAGAGYAGNCIQVRRASGTTQDIGFDSSGNVDVAAALAFAAGSLLTVPKWYDQSGAGLDVVQATVANQPQFTIINGKPWLGFSQTADRGYTLATATVPVLTGNQMIGFVGQLMSDMVMMPISQFDGTNGWFLTFNGGGSSYTIGDHPGNLQYFTTGGGSVRDSGRYFADTGRYAAKRFGGTGTTYFNGSSTTSGAAANSPTTTAGFRIGGSFFNDFAFNGLMSEVYLYASTGATDPLSDANRLAIDVNQAATYSDTGFSTPYSGTAAIEPSAIERIDCGNVLAYERTGSWTVFVAAQMYAIPTAAAVLYTNVPGSIDNSFPGHEIWIDPLGLLRVRIMNNFGAGNLIGVQGTTNVIDGKKHMFAYTYNGSSTTAGIKIYIDGVLETTTIEAGALTGSIIAAGQRLWIGNQQASPPTGTPSLNATGTISFFQIDNIVRSQSYIANYVPGSGTLIPPADATTDIRLLLNEGTGTTAADTSGHGNNGTLNSATMWMP